METSFINLIHYMKFKSIDIKTCIFLKSPDFEDCLNICSFRILQLNYYKILYTYMTNMNENNAFFT